MFSLPNDHQRIYVTVRSNFNGLLANCCKDFFNKNHLQGSGLNDRAGPSSLGMWHQVAPNMSPIHFESQMTGH